MNYQEELNPIIAAADMYIKNFLFAISPIYKEEHGADQDVPVQLFTSLHSTSESILILLLNQALSDADVLLRTVMEGTIKYCYMMTGTPEEKHSKYLEYKRELTEIDQLTDHQKAVEAIDILKEFSSNSTKPFEIMILPEDVLNELKGKYPRSKKSELKQRWSYQGLLRTLAKNYLEYKAELGSLSTYALTSHLIHYDWTGLSIRQSQIMNGDTENSQKADVAQAIRIVHNVLSMYLFRLTEYMRGNGYQSIALSKNMLQMCEFLEQLTQRQNELIDSII